MSELLKGAPVALQLTEELKERCRVLTGKGIKPCLALIRVGEREDDLFYERAILKRCEAVGILVRQFVFKSSAHSGEILSAIDTVNTDPGIHGCLIFRPLPDKALEEQCAGLLDPKKDVDGMTSGALSRVFTGEGEGFPPCTAASCMEILKHYGIELSGKNAVVIGRSLVIGKPVAMMLLNENATVTICHSKTADLPAICRRADIIVAALGRAGFVGPRFVREGQVIIDVGINADEEGNPVGDVCPDVADMVFALTPVPGGVGSVTTAVLASHVIEGAEESLL